MQDTDQTVECPIHGPSHPTYICSHLSENPEQQWFCDYPTEQNPWPDAWCAACDRAFQREGEWNAKNEAVLGATMTCHHCYEHGKGRSVEPLMQRVEDRWIPFLDAAYAELKDKQASLDEDFGISRYDRWDYDQRNGTILFSNAGTAGVRAEARFIGTVSLPADEKIAGTWLWSWANTSLLPATWEEILAVRSFGEEHQFAKLMVPKWPAEEIDGWELAAVAVKVLNGSGVYRVPSDRNLGFMLLHEVHRVS